MTRNGLGVLFLALIVLPAPTRAQDVMPSAGEYRTQLAAALESPERTEPAGRPAASADPLPSPVPSPGVEVFGDAGSGAKSTTPFQLAAGDYRLDYEATSSTDPCSFVFALSPSDGSAAWRIGDAGLYVYAGSPFQDATYFFVPTDGGYHLDVEGDCAWTAALTRIPSDLTDAGPIHLSGAVFGLSRSFWLAGGDYLLSYTFTSPPSGKDCYISASGLVDPATPYAMMGVGGIGQPIAPDSVVTGEAVMGSMPAGRYAYHVGIAWCQLGASTPVSWDITITRQ